MPTAVGRERGEDRARRQRLGVEEQQPRDGEPRLPRALPKTQETQQRQEAQRDVERIVSTLPREQQKLHRGEQQKRGQQRRAPVSRHPADELVEQEHARGKLLISVSS